LKNEDIPAIKISSSKLKTCYYVKCVCECASFFSLCL
jgi:hypothetical protein